MYFMYAFKKKPVDMVALSSDALKVLESGAEVDGIFGAKLEV